MLAMDMATNLGRNLAPGGDENSILHDVIAGQLTPSHQEKSGILRYPFLCCSTTCSIVRMSIKISLIINLIREVSVLVLQGDIIYRSNT